MRPYLPYRPYVPYWAGSVTAANVVDVTAPALSTAEIGDVDFSTLVLTFSEPVESTDFTLGWTITVNGITQTISTATLASASILNIVIVGTIYDDQVVLISYNAAVGTITDVSGTPTKNDLASFTNTEIVTPVSLFRQFVPDYSITGSQFIVDYLAFRQFVPNYVGGYPQLITGYAT